MPSCAALEPVRRLVMTNPAFWCGFPMEILLSTLLPILKKHMKVPFALQAKPNQFFFAFMAWMKRGWTFEMTSKFLGLSEPTTRRAIKQTIFSLSSWASSSISFPTLSEWKRRNDLIEGLVKDFPHHLFYWVDGTVLETWVSGEVFYFPFSYKVKNEK